MTSKQHPLDELIAIETDARAFGFDWPDAVTIVEQAESECLEIREAILQRESSARIHEEIGDLLHTAVSLCLFMGFSPEETLMNVNQKFGGRMQKLKQIAEDKGYHHLRGQDFKTMLALWDEAKKEKYCYCGLDVSA
jgi:uncharacterized protein YabN with tetrapyrrole methylase and pyrophosphatase domain